jgi:hypothetical protein
MKTIFISIQLILLSLLVKGEASQRKVVTWIPPYAIKESQKMLMNTFDGAKSKSSITHLCLQFWEPTALGGIKKVDKYGMIDDQIINELRLWCQKHEIKLIFCVYNGVSNWNWALAQKSFDENQDVFINALLEETMRLKLDGIDIDFEGKGSRDSDKKAFVQFIQKLSSKLHSKDKTLTLDSFAYKWNAPNINWWPELLPLIDGLNVMGYSETGVNSKGWRSYQALKKAAGDHSHKLNIGVASHQSHWQGTALETHLNWILKDDAVGLAIWDAQLKDPAWKDKQTWLKISRISNKQTQ